MSEWRKIVGSLIFRRGIRWMWLFIFTFRPLYSLTRKLIERQSRSGRLLKERLLPFLIIEPRFLGFSARALIFTWTEAYRFVVMHVMWSQWYEHHSLNTYMEGISRSRLHDRAVFSKRAHTLRVKVETEAGGLTPQVGCPSLTRVAIATSDLLASFHLGHILFHINK